MDFNIGTLKSYEQETWEKKKEELKKLLQLSMEEGISSKWLVAWVKHAHQTVIKWHQVEIEPSVKDRQIADMVATYLQLGHKIWDKCHSLEKSDAALINPYNDAWPYAEVLQVVVRELFDVIFPRPAVEKKGSALQITDKSLGLVFSVFDFLLKLKTLNFRIGDRTEDNIVRFIDNFSFGYGRVKPLHGWSQYCRWEDEKVIQYAQYLAELALAYDPQLLVKWRMFEAIPVVAKRISYEEPNMKRGSMGEVWYEVNPQKDRYLRHILAILKAEEEYVLEFREKSEDKRMPVAWRKLPVSLPLFA